MPGTPLPEPTKNLKNSNFTYTPEDGWGLPAVTAAPKAVFDANSGPDSLRGAFFGHVKIKDAAQVDSYPNTLSPDGINKGWELTYGQRLGAYQDNGGMEIKYELVVPSSHNWEYLRIRQPDNYEHRRIVALNIPDYASVSDWQPGDIVSSGGFSGEIYSIEDNTLDPGPPIPSVAIHKYKGGNPANSLDAGSTVTNQRTGTSVTSEGYKLSPAGMKFMSLWVDDGTSQDGYSNAGFLIGVTSAPPQYDDEPSGYATASTQFTYDLDREMLYGPTGDFIGDDNFIKVYDVEDNGHWINWVVEKKRASAQGANDGIYRIWKKVERAGSPHEEWTLLFEKTNVWNWSPYSDNNFTHGYMFGNSNAGHYEDTKYYLNRWEYWTQKPTFLTDAGV